MLRTLDIVSDYKRLRTLILISEGKNLGDVPQLAKISESGLYKFLKDFVLAGLLEKPAEGQYVISEKAKKLLPLLKEIEKIDQEFSQKEIERNIRALTSIVSVETLEEIIKKVKKGRDQG